MNSLIYKDLILLFKQKKKIVTILFLIVGLVGFGIYKGLDFISFGFSIPFIASMISIIEFTDILVMVEKKEHMIEKMAAIFKLNKIVLSKMIVSSAISYIVGIATSIGIKMFLLVSNKQYKCEIKEIIVEWIMLLAFVWIGSMVFLLIELLINSQGILSVVRSACAIGITLFGAYYKSGILNIWYILIGIFVGINITLVGFYILGCVNIEYIIKK